MKKGISILVLLLVGGVALDTIAADGLFGRIFRCRRGTRQTAVRTAGSSASTRRMSGRIAPEPPPSKKKKAAPKKAAPRKAAPKKAVTPPAPKKAAPKKAVTPPAPKKAAPKKAVTPPAPKKAAPKKAVTPPAPKKAAPKKAVTPPAPKKAAAKKAVTPPAPKTEGVEINPPLPGQPPRPAAATPKSTADAPQTVPASALLSNLPTKADLKDLYEGLPAAAKPAPAEEFGDIFKDDAKVEATNETRRVKID